ncbi:MAG: GIY-YIG nuclease family protein [bacterium]|nr:GIY-YIG nuclease family protein [bacterium]
MCLHFKKFKERKKLYWYIERRLKEHNFGESKYTKLTKPFVLIYKEEYQTRKEAVQRELFFKSGKGREWIKNNLG